MEANGVIVTRETIERGAVDFTELAERVAADAPSFVGFAGFNPEGALLYRQLRDAGFSGGFGAGDGAASLHDFVEPVGAEAAEGVVFSGCPLLLREDFVADFEAVHGSPPEASGFVGQYADATTALLNAVSEAAQEQSDGSLTIDPAALRDSLRKVNVEDGVSGSFWFDSRGDRVPDQGADLNEAMREAIRTADIGFLVELGLVPCQVQDGKLVNQFGPGTALP
jgi:ABC-type branched-subunit amino acid transport system substrate-binding protein